MKKVVQHFHQYSYGILPNFLSAQKCDEAIKEIDRLISAFQPSKEQMLAFTPGGSQAHFRSSYFRQSADKVGYFFEPKALKDGQLVVPKQHSINKIGHALHQKNPTFASITFNNSIHDICQELGVTKPIVVQSMAILKPPKIGGEVPDHQDSTFLLGEPDTLCAFWIPLQDATLENGCLWGIPGSHKWDKLYKKSRHFPDRNYVEQLHQIDYKSDQFVPIEMKKGSLAFFPGKFIHRSNDNFSRVSRYAYTWHIMDQSSKWAEDNWLQRVKFPKLEKNQSKTNFV